MSRLPLIDPKQAEGKAKELLEIVQKKMGATPNMTRAMAVAPSVLEGYLQLSGALSNGVLTPRVREQIALHIGQENGCDYCVSAHSYIGGKLGLGEQDLLASREGKAVDPKTDALLALAGRIVATKGEVSDGDLQHVRDAGGSDTEIAEVVGHVALNVLTNYFNILAETPIDFPVAPKLAV